MAGSRLRLILGPVDQAAMRSFQTEMMQTEITDSWEKPHLLQFSAELARAGSLLARGSEHRDLQSPGWRAG